MGAPLLTVYLTGRMDLTGYVVFGAFTAIFGRGIAYRPRITMQTTVGVSLVLSVGLGALLSTAAAQTVLAVGVARPGPR